MMVFRIALVLLALMIAGSGAPVRAMSEPTSVSIDDPFVFRSLIEADDFLGIAPYEAAFASTPDDPISDTFLFKFIDIDGTTELGSIVAYAFVTKGYGKGVVSFYFSAADAPAWEGAYTIRIEQNPTFYPSPQVWSFPLAVGSYSQVVGQTLNRSLLRTKILAIADVLNLTYPSDLKTEQDTGTFLSDFGEDYFRVAIQGLQNMAPALFVLQVREADYAQRSWTTTFADTFATQYAGTWVDTGLTSFGSIFSMDTKTAWGFVVLAVAVIVMGFAFKQTKQVMPGFLDALVVIIGGMLLGMFSPLLLGLIIFASVFVGGMVLFLNRA